MHVRTLEDWQHAAEVRAEELRIDARLLAVEMRREYPVRSPRPRDERALPCSPSDQ